MKEIRQKKVYVPPVVEELNMEHDVQLLQNSIWDGKYGMNHTTSTEEEDEGLTITRQDMYGSAVW